MRLGALPLAQRPTRLVLLGTMFIMLLSGVLTLFHFPYSLDDLSVRRSPSPLTLEARQFYEKAYRPSGSPPQAADAKDSPYVTAARDPAGLDGVVEGVAGFVRKYGLQSKRVLDVGSGSGLLQDLVPDYTGLDIAASARRFFHKPFVHASATEMPFADGEFDAIWTIGVLEHIESPERALLEMRRVVKSGGLLYLDPAWNCSSWASQGYDVRPYSDFGLVDKLIKATIPVRRSFPYRVMYFAPIRALRALSETFLREPTRLRYVRLKPNYQEYWGPDSDAVTSIDCYEVYLWFISRGDMCLNRPGRLGEIFRRPCRPLIIQVRKGTG